MHIPSIILTIGVFALMPDLVWPAPARHDPDEPFSMIDPFADPFGEFLRKIRLSEDSAHFILGEQTFQRQRFDSALSHHLAAHVPASGAFRDTLLAQRSRIFAQVWPQAFPDAGKNNAFPIDSLSAPSKPEFVWGMGASHSRGLFRTGFWRPDGWMGTRFEERYSMYDNFVRQSWPLSIGGNALNLAAKVNQSTAAEFSTLDAAMETHVQDGILANLSVILSGGRRKSPEWGSYQSYDLLVSRSWYSGSSGMGAQAGISREWNADGKWMNDYAWLTLHRDIAFEGGNSLGVFLNAGFDRQATQYDWITVPVLFVDDVSKARPTHFRAMDFRDTLHANAADAFGLFAHHAGALQLAMAAPRAYFSLSPALQFGFSLPAGFGAMAGASYGLDIHRESAWDWVPTPDSMDLSNADLLGLAFNRADRRYYAAALVEENGALRESYGAMPLQHRKARRVDQRVGLNMGIWRNLPHGYTLALESSAGLGWTNLSDSSPIGSQPWQWGLSFNVSRTSSR